MVNEKIEKQGFIDYEDVKDLKFVASIRLTQKLLRCAEKISYHVGQDFNELLEAIGLKEPEEKKEDPEKKGQSKKIALQGLFNLFILNGYVDDKPNELLDELVGILSEIVRVKKDIILDSSAEVLLELIIRSIFNYRNEANKSFFTTTLINTVLPILSKVIPTLSGMSNKNLNLVSE